MYNYDWFALSYGRNQHNTVKSFFLIFKFKKIEEKIHLKTNCLGSNPALSPTGSVNLNFLIYKIWLMLAPIS